MANKVKRTQINRRTKRRHSRRIKRTKRTKRVKRSKRTRRSFLKNKRKTQKRKRVLRGGMEAAKVDKAPERLGPEEPLNVRIENLKDILRYNKDSASSLRSKAVDPTGSDGSDQTGNEEWYDLQELELEIKKDTKILKDLEAEMAEATLTRQTANRRGDVGEDPTGVRTMGDYSGDPYHELSPRQRAVLQERASRALVKEFGAAAREAAQN